MTYEQFPPPVMLLGDFNAYEMWGSLANCDRGRMIEEFIKDNDLNILNTGAPTRIEGNSETSIDLSIVSPKLRMCNWDAFKTPRDGDYCPILITMNGNNQYDFAVTKRNYRKADWKAYKSCGAWHDLRENNLTCADLIEDLYRTLKGQQRWQYRS